MLKWMSDDQIADLAANHHISTTGAFPALQICAQPTEF